MEKGLGPASSPESSLQGQGQGGGGGPPFTTFPWTGLWQTSGMTATGRAGRALRDQVSGMIDQKSATRVLELIENYCEL